MSNLHKPVLLDEAINGLDIKEDGIYVDCTMGRGGHSEYILNQLSDNGLLISIDRDDTAIEYCKEKFKNRKNIKIVKGRFSEIDKILKDLEIERVNGILADIGVSSPMLDVKERGFSFMKDGPLDMRMDQNQEKDAKYVVNNYSEEEISRILHCFAEEKWHKKIARSIINYRENKEIETTLELTEIVKKTIPRKFWEKKINPATRTFQAIRIEVNQELNELEVLLEKSLEILEIGGRVSIITFHSKEHTILKKFLKNQMKYCVCPKDLPICMCNKKKTIKKITGKPITPTSDEIDLNVRSRSAKLFIYEKI